MPVGSILGTILFNILLNELFSFLKEARVANFADDLTLLAIKIVKAIRNSLQNEF